VFWPERASYRRLDELARYFTRYFGWQVVSEKFEAALGENDFGDCMRSVGDNEGFAEFWRDAGCRMAYHTPPSYPSTAGTATGWARTRTSSPIPP
jgi:hypothetical protein